MRHRGRPDARASSKRRSLSRLGRFPIRDAMRTRTADLSQPARTTVGVLLRVEIGTRIPSSPPCERIRPVRGTSVTVEARSRLVSNRSSPLNRRRSSRKRFNIPPATRLSHKREPRAPPNGKTRIARGLSNISIVQRNCPSEIPIRNFDSH